MTNVSTFEAGTLAVHPHYIVRIHVAIIPNLTETYNRKKWQCFYTLPFLLGSVVSRNKHGFLIYCSASFIRKHYEVQDCYLSSSRTVYKVLCWRAIEWVIQKGVKRAASLSCGGIYVVKSRCDAALVYILFLWGNSLHIRVGSQSRPLPCYYAQACIQVQAVSFSSV